MKSHTFPSLLLGICCLATRVDAVPFTLHAKTWTDVGRIMHSTDTLQFNFNGNFQQGMGLQFNSAVDLGESLEAGFGFGAVQIYHSLGNAEQEKFTLSKFMNFVSEARLTWYAGEKENPSFSATVGDFAYNYAPHVRNLGLYLFRGPVYPGFLVSGFKDFHTDTTRASFLGFRLHHAVGGFQHDVLFSGEREFAPSFDWSLGYVARYQAFGALEIGAGANFYHLISENEDVTSPGRNSIPGLFGQDSTLIASGTPYHPYQLKYMEVVAPGDTVAFTHRGIKAMAMFSLDVQKLLGISGSLGKKDLFLYGEGAIIGIQNQGTVYSKIRDRMPVMVGFNLPTFGLLDFLSIEVEHYTAKYKADYSKLGYYNSLYLKNITAPPLKAQRAPSAVPISIKDLAGERYTLTTCPDGSPATCQAGNFIETATGDTLQIRGTALDVENLTADDFKWSLNAEKTLFNHVQFSAQVANDHFVPRPVRAGLITEDSGLSQVLTSQKDWYFMFRVGYSF